MGIGAGKLLTPVSAASVDQNGRRYSSVFWVETTNCEHADRVLSAARAGSIANIPAYGTSYRRSQDENVAGGDCTALPAVGCDPDAYCDIASYALRYNVRVPNQQECNEIAHQGGYCGNQDPGDSTWIVEVEHVPPPNPGAFRGGDPSNPTTWCPELTIGSVPGSADNEKPMRFGGFSQMEFTGTECNKSAQPVGGTWGAVTSPCFPPISIDDCWLPVNSAGIYLNDLLRRFPDFDIQVRYSDFGSGLVLQPTSLDVPQAVNQDKITINLGCRTAFVELTAETALLQSVEYEPNEANYGGDQIYYYRRTISWIIRPTGWCINAPNRSTHRCVKGPLQGGDAVPDGRGGDIAELFDPCNEANSIWEPLSSRLAGQQPVYADGMLDVNGQLDCARAVNAVRWCPDAIRWDVPGGGGLLDRYGGSANNPGTSTPYITGESAVP